MSYLYILPQIDGYVKFLTKYINLDDKKNKTIATEDILILDKEKILISDIKEVIQFVNLRPVREEKVVVIGPFENVTIEAQNAFLKTLEEPPSYCSIILYSFSLQKILDTIKSRCQIINLKQNAKDKGNGIKQSNILNSKKSLLDSFSNANNITLEQLLSLINQTKWYIETSNFSIIQKTMFMKHLANLQKALTTNSNLKNIYELIMIIKDLYEI